MRTLHNTNPITNNKLMMKLLNLLIATLLLSLSSSALAMTGIEDATAWEIGLFLNKLLLYIALAMTVGGLAALFTLSGYQHLENSFVPYLLLGSLLGAMMSVYGFFLQVGSFAEMGIAGMWNQDFLPILWDSGSGQSLRFQLLGWFLVVSTVIVIWVKPHIHPIFSTIAFLGTVIIAISFTLTGHTASAPLWVRMALTLHVITAMWWIGSLYPLRCACSVLPIGDLKTLMSEFAQQAVVLVGLLVIVGIGVAYHLEGNFDNLLNTAHGNTLLVKLAAVATVLLLAARHKWRLVPKLRSTTDAQILKRSITIEMTIGFVVLLITAVLSTLTGPASG